MYGVGKNSSLTPSIFLCYSIFMKLPLVRLIAVAMSLLALGAGALASYFYTQVQATALAQQQIEAMLQTSSSEKLDLSSQLSSISAELEALRTEDQKVRNDKLEEEIKNIQATYNSAVETYENLVKLREKTTKTTKQDELFAKALTDLSKRNYSTASAQLNELDKLIIAETEKLAIAAATAIPANVPQSNAPPGSGYGRQQVNASIGTYMVSLVAADMNSTRVIVDTASSGDCANDCPVLSLGDYVSRNGAFAGINGSYFCPASYPTCAGKTNSFDTLLMNKNKVYFNSGNNVYSTTPAVIFGNGWMRFVGQSLEWGRDTGVDGVLANPPLLVSGNNVVFGGDGDPKKGSKGNRSFVANKGSTAYIGVVHSATVAEAAHVLKALGMDNGLNLDSGGSTALWSGGYKLGPGRGIPNAILFVKK
jgi:hypothetical protein